ncbi:MAG TPA: adenylate/guanylate cyclase domain-containing protein [Patescibacteria group bacterium]|nr:adenylate/guanylate cyclase domain-containing protein [Patescibacteria group bacterium]
MTDADGELLRGALQTLESGVAVVDPATWSVAFENATFFAWFAREDDVDATLPDRIPGMDAGRAAGRLEAGRPYTFETFAGTGARARTLDVSVRGLQLGDRTLAIVEAIDATKRRQAEAMLDSYSKMAERNARDLQREKERVEKLLLNLMPRSVYEELKQYGVTTPQRFDSASVLLLDFVGFTDMALARDPAATIAELNDIFSAFDRITELFGGERVKTIGDAYMAVAGIPESTPDHAHSLARCALRMRRYLQRRNEASPEQWRCRIGIATGPLIGSIIGIQKYVYDVFGPAVNLASRLEGMAEPMQIVIDEATHLLMGDDFACTELGVQDLKGFGEQHVWSLEDERAQHEGFRPGL